MDGLVVHQLGQAHCGSTADEGPGWIRLAREDGGFGACKVAVPSACFLRVKMDGLLVSKKMKMTKFLFRFFSAQCGRSSCPALAARAGCFCRRVGSSRARHTDVFRVGSRSHGGSASRALVAVADVCVDVCLCKRAHWARVAQGLRPSTCCVAVLACPTLGARCIV